MPFQSFTYDVAQKLSKNSYTRTGYTFDGWAETATGEVKYTDEQSVSNLTSTAGATVTLYAHWDPTISNKITFDGTEYDSPATSIPAVLYKGNGKGGYDLTAFSDIPEGDGYTISWSQNGQAVNGTSKTQPITTVSDTGTWTAKLLTKEEAETGKSVTATVTVNPRSVNQTAIVIAVIPDVPWNKNGGSFVPTSLTVTDNGNALTAGADKDYTAAYSDNTDVTATAKATITGKNNYKDTKDKTYRIVLSIDANGANLQDILDYIANHSNVSPDLVICPENINVPSGIHTAPTDDTKGIINTILGKVTAETISNFTLEVNSDGSNIASVIDLVNNHSGVTVNFPDPLPIPENTEITVTTNNKTVVTELINKAADASKITLVITNDNLSDVAAIFGTAGVKDKNVKAKTNSLTINTADKLTAMGTILANVNSTSKSGLANNSTVTLTSLDMGGKKIVKELYDCATDSTKKSAYQEYLKSTFAFHADDKTGGSIPSGIVATYDTAAPTGFDGKPIRTGYHFNGWAIGSAEGTPLYDAENTVIKPVTDYTDENGYWISIASPVNLHAIWSEKEPKNIVQGTITGGSVTINPTSAVEGSTVTLTPVPGTGHSFKTGSLKAKYTEGGIQKECSVTETTTSGVYQFTMVDYDVTITAEFEPNDYTVTFDTQGHGTAPAPLRVAYGDTVPVPKSPEAEGLTFEGWYKEPACTNAWNFETDTVSGNTILYAKWVHGLYTVKFDGNGGDVTTPTKLLRYGDTIKLSEVTTASRFGYTHSGWSLAPAGKAVYAVNQEVQDLGDITLYAVWTKNDEVFEISVKVTEAGDPKENIKVELKQGNAVLDTKKTDASGITPPFTNLTKGTYNLVATSPEGKIMTQEVTLPDASKVVPIAFPSADVSSVVEVSSKTGTPAVVVGGADAEAIAKAKEGKFVTLVVKVEAKVEGDKASTEEETQKEIAEIKKLAGSSELQYLGITIEQTVREGEYSETTPLYDTENILEFIIPYDFTGKTLSQLTLYRCHKENEKLKATDLIKLPNKPAPEERKDGRYFLDEEKGLIYLYAQKFSTYSIGYIKSSPKPSHGGSSGSSYWITPTQTAQPTVKPTAEPTVNPTQGIPTAQPTAKSPAPIMGILAGLGAAAVVFGLRRK